MKSVVLTFLMLVIIFAVLKTNVLAIVDVNVLEIVFFVLFVIVMGCAVYFVGIPDFRKVIKYMAEDEDEINEEKKKIVTKKSKKGRKKV